MNMYIIIGLEAIVSWVVYEIIKAKRIAVLKPYIIMLNCVFITGFIAPMVTGYGWGEAFWISCLSMEICIIIYIFLFYKRDVKAMPFYKIFNDSGLFVLVSRQTIEKISLSMQDFDGILHIFFETEVNYKIPINLAFINVKGNEVVLSIFFWNRSDCRNFLCGNKDILIVAQNKKEILLEKRFVL